LSSSAKPARGVIDSALPELAGRISTPVFIGGKAADSHRKALEASGIFCLGEDIRYGLQVVSDTLNAAGSR
jgi:hypothetical protein